MNKDLIAIFRAVLLGIWKRTPFDDPQARLGWYLVLATLPAGLFGLGMRDVIAASFESPRATALFLLLTAALLLLAERMGRRTRTLGQITWKDALIVGLFQVLSVFPGVSRSGSTIAGGMTRALDRPTAARFSFLMSVPVMLAAGVLSGFDLAGLADVGSFLPALAAGFVSAALVGYLAIRWLLGYLARYSLHLFALYVTILGVVILIVL